MEHCAEPLWGRTTSRMRESGGVGALWQSNSHRLYRKSVHWRRGYGLILQNPVSLCTAIYAGGSHSSLLLRKRRVKFARRLYQLMADNIHCQSLQSSLLVVNVALISALCQQYICPANLTVTLRSRHTTLQAASISPHWFSSFTVHTSFSIS